MSSRVFCLADRDNDLPPTNNNDTTTEQLWAAPLFRQPQLISNR